MSEFKPVGNAVFAGGLSPGAIHNHDVFDATTLAQGMETATGQTGD